MLGTETKMNKAPFNVITLGKRIGREITNIETYRQAGSKKKERLRDRQTKRQTNRPKTEKLTDRRTNRQTGQRQKN